MVTEWGQGRKTGASEGGKLLRQFIYDFGRVKDDFIHQDLNYRSKKRWLEANNVLPLGHDLLLDRNVQWVNKCGSGAQ